MATDSRRAAPVRRSAERRGDRARRSGRRATPRGARRLAGRRTPRGVARRRRAFARSRSRSIPTPRSTSSIRRARPARPRASSSRTGCAGCRSGATRATASRRGRSRWCRRRCTRTRRWCVFVPAIAGGGTVVLMAKFDAAEFLRAGRAASGDARDAGAGAVSTTARPSRFRRHRPHAHSAASSAPARRSRPTLKAEVLRRWPGGLVETYGLTEGGGACMLEAHVHPDKLHTVGPADRRARVAAHRRARASRCAPGAAGEVVGRSGGMMIGYHGQPEATRRGRVA